jgi:hypothetical protein
MDYITNVYDSETATTTVIYDPDSRTWTANIADDDATYAKEVVEGETIADLLMGASIVFDESYRDVVTAAQGIKMRPIQWSDVYDIDIEDPEPGWPGNDITKPIDLKDYAERIRKCDLDAVTLFDIDTDNAALNGITV